MSAEGGKGGRLGGRSGAQGGWVCDKNGALNRGKATNQKRNVSPWMKRVGEALYKKVNKWEGWTQVGKINCDGTRAVGGVIYGVWDLGIYL